MLVKRDLRWKLWSIGLLLLIGGVLLVACGPTESDTTDAASIHTWLLVRAPDGPLPASRPIDVISRTEDDNGVSHVELYAVQLPTGEKNVLIRSDPAPFEQTAFTASQAFTPMQPGHYVIKVVGYNKLGQSAESDYIGFEVQ